MQDIFIDEPEPPKKKVLYEKPTRYASWDILNYVVSKHVSKYGESVAAYYNEDAVNRIKTHTNIHKIPPHHYLYYVFSEMLEKPVWVNVIIGKDWPVKFNYYLDGIDIEMEHLRNLHSPLALSCYVEFRTFQNCSESFLENGGELTELIKRFLFSNRISTPTLEFIYRTMHVEDAVLAEYFNTYNNTQKIKPFEDIDPDLNYLITKKLTNHEKN